MMELRETVTVYQCTECNYQEVVEQYEQPPEECPECATMDDDE